MPVQENLYFIALVPAEPLRSEAWALKEHMRDTYGSKASLNSPAHITLHMPFELKQNREKAVIASLQELAEGYKSFNIDIDGYGAFPPRVLFLHVVPNATLSRLQSDVHELMKRGFNVFNADYKKKPFHPHITLAFRDLKKERFKEAWEEYREKEFKADWQVQGLTLLRHDGRQWQELAQAIFANVAGVDEEE
ncbi:RNA 2',3'-cyclic phosphodiesterase [Cesiribacter sp. SM1]|uniref:RNA 2',3'-cyclic phosphodiesterase n=1 Tax=Cesiribacter sp. SM1 TaxID=2861196 RepID=UPI001CD6103C|nr:RNA 2',3'-cyclic phosphodiesterase [Cesiribacter sp. SM1]